MSIRIEHCDGNGRHIELYADGSIGVYIDGKLVTIEYRQAAMLKAMILAEAELNRQAQR